MSSLNDGAISYSVGGEPKGSPTQEVYSRKQQLECVKELGRVALNLLDKKGDDYSPEFNLFSAFEFMGYVLDYAISNGVQGQDLAFVALEAVKLSRMITVCSSQAIHNESFTDSCQDAANYALLWAASKRCPGIK